MNVPYKESDEKLIVSLIKECKAKNRHATDTDIAKYLLNNAVIPLTEENIKTISSSKNNTEKNSPVIATIRYHDWSKNAAKIASCFDEECVEILSIKPDSCGIYVKVKAKFLNKAHLNRVVNYLNICCDDAVSVKHIRKTVK